MPWAGSLLAGAWSQVYGGHWVVVGHEGVPRAARDWRNFSSVDGVVLAGTKPKKYVLGQRLVARLPNFVVPRDAVIEYRMGQSRGPASVPVVFSA